jgi:hypothetical protein
VSIVGLYVIRIYKDVRRRPPYVVESTIGVETAPGRSRVRMEEVER